MNKKVKINTWISSIILALALVACKSYDEPNVSKDTNDVYMSFETSFLDDANNSMRTLSWNLEEGANRIPIASLDRYNSVEQYPAIIVIKNKPASGGTQKTYYLDQTFYRRGLDRFKIGGSQEERNRGVYEVRLDRDIYDQEIKLNRTDEWYMMAYFKGEWNRDAKTMSYEPIKNNWITYKSGQRVIVTRKNRERVGNIDQPIILPWIKMTLSTATDNKLRFAPESTSIMPVIPMGTIITARFTNTVSALRSVIRVKIYSNVLTTKKGFYNLANDRLPALPINGSTTINYPEWNSSEQVNTDGYYDSDYLEMINNYGGNGGWHTPNLSANGSEYQYYPMIWAMPMPLASGTPRTELRAQIGMDRNGNNAYRRHTAYEAILWSSNSNPKHNTSIGILGTVTNTEIPGTRTYFGN